MSASFRRELPTYRRQGSAKKFIRSAVFVVVAVFLVCSVFQCTFLRPVAVSSVSMAPALRGGDFIVCSPLVYGKEVFFSDHSYLDFAGPRRGDIVLMRPPYHQEQSFVEKLLRQGISFASLGRRHSPSWESSEVLRRVIALPGDEVYMSDDRYFVKIKGSKDFVDEFAASGKRYAVKDPKLTVRQADMAFAESMPPLTVPPRTCFVAGDNRDAALDSRYWGVVDIGALRGQMLFRYWPPQSFGLVQ